MEGLLYKWNNNWFVWKDYCIRSRFLLQTIIEGRLRRPRNPGLQSGGSWILGFLVYFLGAHVSTPMPGPRRGPDFTLARRTKDAPTSETSPFQDDQEPEPTKNLFSKAGFAGPPVNPYKPISPLYHVPISRFYLVSHLTNLSCTPCKTSHPTTSSSPVKTPPSTTPY